MPRKKLPPLPPDAVIPPVEREGPVWDQFCAEHPLHKAVAGKASQHVMECRITEILGWLHEGKVSHTVIQLGVLRWGLTSRMMEETYRRAAAVLRERLNTDRHEYLAAWMLRLEGATEQAIKDRQFSAAAGLAAILGRWTYLEPSTTRKS